MTTTHAPYPMAAVGWQPPADLRDHRGEPSAGLHEFFAPPPTEIGTIFSAESTLKRGRKPIPVWGKVLIASGIGGIIFVLMAFFAEQSGNRSDRETIQGFGFILGVVGFGIYLWFSGSKPRCTYVGEHGVAQFTMRGRDSANPIASMMLFNQAAEIHTAQTRHYTNGIYTGTSYDFYWNDAAGMKLMRLKGRHHGNKKAPKAGSPFHFARAGELAWTQHYMDRAYQSLTAEGSIPFRVDGKRWIRVGPGFIEFHFGDSPVRITKDEIATVTLGSGQFSFKHKDAKWFSRAGKFSFNYGTMANAQVFVISLDKLMGYRWN